MVAVHERLAVLSKYKRYMKLIKFILVLCVIIIIIVAAAQILVKEFGSDKIGETLKNSLENSTMKDFSFNEISINLLGSSALITDIHAPLKNPETGLDAGLFSAKTIELKFSMKDALSMLSNNAALSEASIECTEPILVMENSFPIKTSAEKLTIKYIGKLEREYFSEIQSGNLERILQEKQEFQIKFDKIAFSVQNSELVTIFIDGLKSRTKPVSGLEIALVSAALLPDIPITRNIIQAATNSTITIEPEQFSRIVSLGTQLLGIGTDESMESDGKVMVSTEGKDLVITGILDNPIGHFIISGLGEVNTDDAFLSEVSEMSVEISGLNSDLSEILERDTINLILQAPIMLKYLIQGDYAFK